MTKDQKIIRAKAGLLELAKQLGNVSRANCYDKYAKSIPGIRPGVAGCADIFRGSAAMDLLTEHSQ